MTDKADQIVTLALEYSDCNIYDFYSALIKKFPEYEEQVGREFGIE